MVEMLVHIISGILLVYFGGALGEKDDLPTAEILLGKLEGYYKLSYGGRQFVAFEGIPYAHPPIGDLRFEPPQEPKSWTGVLKANKTYTCIQLSWFDRTQPLGTEDCLYLNVYTPKDAKSLDVVVYIHGGAFMLGSAHMAGPEYLMDKDIVYVSINYRLGPFGFLSTEDAVVPGNMGLKDQSFALAWVQKHIKNFGGNPNSVTIVGMSAGAGSVHLHYFSPLSKELFHKGISQGGTALTPWAIHKSPLSVAKKLAATIGCDNQSTKDLIACLKTQTSTDVVKNVYTISELITFPLVPFGPVIEKPSTGAFLNDYPYKLLNSGRVADLPWITGAVTEEGILCLMSLNFKFDLINEKWDEVLDVLLNYEHVVADMDKRSVAQRIKKFYLNDEIVTDDNVEALIKLFGDRYFYVGMETAARLQAKINKSPVYAYLYGYKQEIGGDYLKQLGITKEYGVGHGSDGALLCHYNMDNLGSNQELSENDSKIKDLMVGIVTSFAKSGTPVANGINWEPVLNQKDFNYLFISNNEIKSTSKPKLAHTEFWESLPLRESANLNSYKDEL